MQFTIRRLMASVAVAGVLGGVLRVPGGGELTAVVVLIVVPAVLAYLYPFLFVKSGRRLVAATWIAALWPLSIPWSLHVTWAVAYGFLGHAPGPADNGPGIEILVLSVLFCVLCSMASTLIWFLLVSLGTSKGNMTQESLWMNRLNTTFLVTLAWFSVPVVCAWDPLQAFLWFMD